jgi:hypothetical protein
MHAMKHLARTLLALAGGMALGLGCRASERPAELVGVLVSDPDGCRSFAALGGVRVGETPGEQRCRFDPIASEHRCEISLGGERIASVAEYASPADFVEAGHAVGKVTSLAETRIEAGQPRRVSHRYDELGRLVRSLEEGTSVTTRTTYTDHDAEGRPRQASVVTGGQREPCVTRVEIEYRDAERLVHRRSRPLDPGRCGFAEQTVIERYDAAGNRVSVDTADGAGVERRFAAHHAAATARVCL